MRRWCCGGLDNHGFLSPLYIGRGWGLQRGRSARQIGFRVCYNKSIIPYHSCDGGRYPWCVMISRLVVMPSPHGLHPRSSSIDGPDIWSVRVPRAHISDTIIHQMFHGLFFYHSLIRCSMVHILSFSWYSQITSHEMFYDILFIV